MNTANHTPLTGKDLGRILLSSWRNAHRDAARTEMAKIEWKIKGIVYREKRAGRIIP